MGGLQRLPAFLIEVRVQPGKNHGTLGQARHRPQQPGGGRRRAGGAGGDHRMVRRRGLPAGDLAIDEPGAPGNRLHEPELVQQLWPDFGDDRKQVQHLLPMIGKILGRQIRELLERQFLDLHLIEQPGQIAGQGNGIGLRPVAVGLAQQAGDDQQAPHRRNGRRQIKGRVLAIFPGAVFGHQVVFVDVADGAQARQQQGTPAAHPCKGVRQRPAGAPGGQQHGHVGQGLRPARLLQQAGGERIQERRARGNRVDLGWPDHHSRPED